MPPVETSFTSGPDKPSITNLSNTAADWAVISLVDHRIRPRSASQCSWSPASDANRRAAWSGRRHGLTETLGGLPRSIRSVTMQRSERGRMIAGRPAGRGLSFGRHAALHGSLQNRFRPRKDPNSQLRLKQQQGRPFFSSLPSPLPPKHGVRRRTTTATTTAGLTHPRIIDNYQLVVYWHDGTQDGDGLADGVSIPSDRTAPNRKMPASWLSEPFSAGQGI